MGLPQRTEIHVITNNNSAMIYIKIFYQSYVSYSLFGLNDLKDIDIFKQKYEAIHLTPKHDFNTKKLSKSIEINLELETRVFPILSLLEMVRISSGVQ